MAFPIGVLTGQGGAITSLDSSGDGKVIASTGTDAMLSVWTAAGADIDLKGRVAVQRKVNDKPRLSVNRDGTRVATANNNGGLVQLWDIADPDRPRAAGSITTQTRYTFAVAFSPRSDVARSRDQRHRRPAVERKQCRCAPGDFRESGGPGDLIRSIAFNTAGTMLAVSSDDANTYVYDLTAVKPTQPTEPVVVIKDSNPASQVTFTRDGTIVLASRDLAPGVSTSPPAPPPSVPAAGTVRGDAVDHPDACGGGHQHASVAHVHTRRQGLEAGGRGRAAHAAGRPGARLAARAVGDHRRGDPHLRRQLRFAVPAGRRRQGGQAVDLRHHPPLTKAQAAALLPHDADTDMLRVCLWRRSGG